VHSAVALLAGQLPDQEILFLNLGDSSPDEQIGEKTRVVYVPFQENIEMVARYYQAADVYVHAAKADTFPNSVLESLACGIPVVATAVGGIPEQIKGLIQEYASDAYNRSDSSEATGILVPAGHAQSMAEAMRLLLTNEKLRLQLGKNACRDASAHFGLQRHVTDYLDWYAEILHQRVKVEVSPSRV